jgi:hypothetical protein
MLRAVLNYVRYFRQKLDSLVFTRLAVLYWFFSSNGAKYARATHYKPIHFAPLGDIFSCKYANNGLILTCLGFFINQSKVVHFIIYMLFSIRLVTGVLNRVQNCVFLPAYRLFLRP